MTFERKEERARSVRVEDVAREAGVSPITVSRALSSPEIVKPETRERVLRAVERTGYVVNTLASSLRSGRSSLVAMFVSNIENPHFARATRGCVDAFENSGFHLMMAQTNYSARIEADFVGSVLPLRPAALVFTGVVHEPTTRAMVLSRGMTVMEMWDQTDNPIDMLVYFSNFEGGRQMGAHFGQAGFRNIAYVGRTTERGALRLEGFREGLAETGASIGHIDALNGHPPVVGDGVEAFRRVMRDYPQCDAMFLSSDTLAIGASLESVRDGEPTVALAGYGNFELTAALPVPLTSVHISSYEMGLRAGRMLLRRLNGEAITEKTVVLPTELLVRDSTLRFVRGN